MGRIINQFNLVIKLNLVFTHKGYSGHIGRRGVAGKKGDKVRNDKKLYSQCFILKICNPDISLKLYFIKIYKFMVLSFC